MTTTAELVDRVRSNVNEPASNDDPQRGDLEIAQWLQDGMLDYISKVPADGLPELVVHATFSGTYWAITSDYIKLLHVVVDHTLSGTGGSTTPITLTEQCYVLDIDEEYIALYSPVMMGAWCKFDRIYSGGTASNVHVIKAGPNCVSGTVTYIGIPASINQCNSTFPLDMEHEEPIVNYATAMALAKINDEDAPHFLERYKERVAAEGVKYPRPWKTEKE